MDYIDDFKAFGIINRIYVGYISKSIEGKNISYSDSIFLLNIGYTNGISQEQLAAALAIDKAAVARSVKTLEKEKYVAVTHNAKDKRIKELYLTESGQAVFDLMKNLNRTWLSKMMSPLSKDEYNSFIRMLHIIELQVKNLQHK